MKEIKQEWKDIIQKANQILLKISQDAWDDEEAHLEDVSCLASTACAKVIDLIDDERWYSLEDDKFSTLSDIIIPPYEE